MSNFTKGEWSVYGDWGICFSGDRDCHVTVEARGEQPKHTKELFANLNLIAAAPEMYDLLESLDVYDGSTSSVKLQDKIDALLAKARGE